MKKARVKIITSGLAVTMLFGLTGCWGEEWTAVTYYVAGRPQYFETIGTYGSLDKCAKAAQKWIRDNGRPGVSTYRCGLNCEGGIVGGVLSNCERSAT